MSDLTLLTLLTLAQARDGLRAKDFTARELASAYLTRIDQSATLNAYILPTPEIALATADAADARIAAGDARPLEGVPIGVKDLFCTKGVRTTAASKILGDFTPSYESTVTERIWQAGGVLLGKLNNDEFAMGSSNETSAFGATINPWRAKDEKPLVPGGSSGGAAAAVAARLACAATATDTGGSIRQPAAFTGTVGLKPSNGRCSRWGIVAFASSLDQAGPITRNVRDAAIMLQHMAGFDAKDSTSRDLPVPDYEAALSGDIRGLRVGIPKEYRTDAMPAAIDALWTQGIDWLKDAGAEPVEISLPHTQYALPAYYIIAPAEASSNLARYDGVRYGMRVAGKDIDDMYAKTRAAGFGDEVVRRVMIGTYVLSAGYYDAYYVKALKVRRLIAEDFTRAFTKCDVLLAPTAPSAAFAIGDTEKSLLDMYGNDVFTVPANLAGLPAVSVPAGLDENGLPLGLQLIGQAFDEAQILRVGAVLEQAAAFNTQPQDWWSA